MDQGQVVTIIVAVIGSGGFTAFVTHLLTRRDARKAAQAHVDNCQNELLQALAEGVSLMLRDKVEFVATRAIEKKEISLKTKKFLKAAHKCYHYGLHQNGDLDETMNEVDKLPVVSQ